MSPLCLIETKMQDGNGSPVLKSASLLKLTVSDGVQEGSAASKLCRGSSKCSRPGKQLVQPALLQAAESKSGEKLELSTLEVLT